MSGRDIGSSVRQRLLNQSRANGRPFQETLQYFAMELLLISWRAPLSGSTMDIDLAGRTNNQLDHIREIVGAVCDIAVDPDGIEFDRASIDVSRIKEDAEYEGVRARFHGTLREPEFRCNSTSVLAT